MLPRIRFCRDVAAAKESEASCVEPMLCFVFADQKSYRTFGAYNSEGKSFAGSVDIFYRDLCLLVIGISCRLCLMNITCAGEVELTMD